MQGSAVDSCILIEVNQLFDKVLINVIGVERGREERIHNPLLGAIYACADDIGAATKQLKHLRLLYQLFER